LLVAQGAEVQTFKEELETFLHQRVYNHYRPFAARRNCCPNGISVGCKVKRASASCATILPG
jgi:hypothetical protein